MIKKAADHKPDNPSPDPRKAAAKLSPGKPPPSASWSRLKDPRVVRVSKALGGKDRHSKVCTVRGLRDRRVRLSVPTAIQLYDLQERLGLTQPSKAVDWLLNAARHEINELPPLQIPPAISITGPANPNATSLHQTLDFHEFRPDKRGLKVGGEDWAGRNDQAGTSRVQDSKNEATDNTCGSIFPPDPSSLMLSHAPRVCHLTSQREDSWHHFGLSPLHVPAFSTSIPLGSHQHHNRAVVYHNPAGGSMNTSCDFLELQAVGSASQPSARSCHFNNTTGNLLHLQGETDGRG